MKNKSASFSSAVVLAFFALIGPCLTPAHSAINSPGALLPLDPGVSNKFAGDLAGFGPQAYFISNGVEYRFVHPSGDCRGQDRCTLSTKPLQHALDAVGRGLRPDDGTIYLSGGVFDEDLLVADLHGDLVLTGVDRERPAVIKGAVEIFGARSAITLQALALDSRGSDIRLTGSRVALVDSHLDTAGEYGGRVEIIGGEVILTGGTTIDASGTRGGGQVNIGGSYRGRGPLPNASRTIIDANIAIDTSSLEGEGGKVVIWGTDEVAFHGKIDTLGGAGGFVEVSTHGTGVIDGNAQTGYMLVDPGDVCVSTASTSGCTAGAAELDDAVIEGVLNLGGTFELNTDVYGTTNSGTGRVDFGGGGNVTINNNTGTMGTFIIHAADEIDTVQVGFLTNGTTGTNYEWYAGSSSTASPVASARIDHFGQVFNTGGGHVIFDAADDIRIGDPLQTSGGDVTLIARGGDGGGRVIFRTADGRIDSAGGTISIQTDTLQINASDTSDPLIDAGAGTVALLPTTAGFAINLGTDTAGSLSIIEADIDRIAADLLRFGDASSGDITISAALSPAQATNLSLVTGGNIVDGNASGADVTATGLALQAPPATGWRRRSAIWHSISPAGRSLSATRAR